MSSQVRTLASIAMALASIGATPSTIRSAGHESPRPPVVTARSKQSVPPAVTRLRALLALPKHRAESTPRIAERQQVTSVSAYHVIDLQQPTPSGPEIFYPIALSNNGRILGVLGGIGITAYVINYDGTVVYLDNSNTCCVYGTYSVYPTAIDSMGQAVSASYDLYTPPFPYDPSLPGTDTYGGLYWSLTGATGSSEYFTPQPISSFNAHDIGVSYDTYYIANAAYSLQTNACGQQSIGATAINDAGLIGGYDNEGGSALVMKIGGCPTIVPNLAPGSSEVTNISKSGDLLVYGDAYPHGSVLWKQGNVYTIPPPPRASSPTYITASGINASDTIVGQYASMKPFVYVDGASVDLASLFPANSGWDPVSVTGINDNGEIIGMGYKNNVLGGFALRH